MESDAEKVCDLTTLTIDVKPAMAQLGVKAVFGDEESKKKLKINLMNLKQI